MSQWSVKQRFKKVLKSSKREKDKQSYNYNINFSFVTLINLMQKDQLLI